MRIKLTSPNIAEMAIIAKVRLYHKILKISSNNKTVRRDMTHSKIRGHLVAFDHDAPLIADQNINPDELNNFFRLNFFGKNEKFLLV